jgi:hypothetical protein
MLLLLGAGGDCAQDFGNFATESSAALPVIYLVRVALISILNPLLKLTSAKTQRQ